MRDDENKSEILQVVETDAVYFLRIDYQEGDIASAVGHVFRTSDTRQAGVAPIQVLATNDPLRVMWASPAGTLWVGGASGSVGTTALVLWAAPSSGGDFLTLGDSARWTATDLPRVRATGLRPNITALWGTGDSDVYAGTYGGHVFRWDGTAWAQVYDGPGGSTGTIRAFGGVPQDVYALGQDATILHFNGRAWVPLHVPGPANGHENFNGIVRRSEGDVLIAGSGESGRLLHGSAVGGLAELGRYSTFLIDMAPLAERILFATGDGVAELIGRDVGIIKSTFRTSTMSPGHERLFFIEPAQETPRFVEYDPRNSAAPWWRVTY